MPRAASLALLLLGGCLSMSESECRGTDWHALGKRDSEIYGIRPQIEAYADRCSAYGVTPDEKQYLIGWQDGQWERIQRGGGEIGLE